MSKETPDEFAGSERLWRKLLREPDALPGEALADKDVAWDKLFERLNTRPRRRFSGYRIAAAIFLILLIPAARLFQDRPVLVKKPVSGKIQPVPGRLSPQSPIMEPAAAVIPPATAVVPPATPFIGPAASVTQARPSVTVLPLAPAGRPASGDPAHSRRLETSAPTRSVQELAAVHSSPAPTVLTAAAPVIPATGTLPQAHPPKPAPKKQLKVVDINELEPDHAPPPGMMADRRPHLLRLGLGIRNIPATDNPSPARDEDSRLKINLTAQN